MTRKKFIDSDQNSEGCVESELEGLDLARVSLDNISVFWIMQDSSVHAAVRAPTKDGECTGVSGGAGKRHRRCGEAEGRLCLADICRHCAHVSIPTFLPLFLPPDSTIVRLAPPSLTHTQSESQRTMPEADNEIAGKLALITGASGGSVCPQRPTQIRHTKRRTAIGSELPVQELSGPRACLSR